MGNIKFRKFLRNVSLCGIPLVATSFSLVSCNKQDLKVDSVEITSEINDVTINLGQENMSSSLLAKCFNKNKEELSDKEIKFELLNQEGNRLPNWIYLNQDNQICVDKDNKAGSWTLEVIASCENVLSKVKTFKVTIIDPRLIPDEIEVDCPESINVLTPTINHLSIGIIAYKDQKISSECNKLCTWQINSIQPINPAQITPNFVLEDLGYSASFYTYAQEFSKFNGQYNVTIQAQSLANPDLIATKTIFVNLASGWVYTDPKNNYVYQRQGGEGQWILSYVPLSTQIVEDVKDEIFDIPVYKVGENFCPYLSEAEYLIAVDLPESITEIGACAFSNQTKLITINMPGVKKIGLSAFNGCSNLRFSSEDDQPRLEEVDSWAFRNCKYIDFQTKQHLSVIANHAFDGTGITNLYNDADLISIGDGAFANCKSLQSVTFNDATPATLTGEPFKDFATTFKIFVPGGAKNEYMTQEGWNNYSSYIFAIQ